MSDERIQKFISSLIAIKDMTGDGRIDAPDLDLYLLELRSKYSNGVDRNGDGVINDLDNPENYRTGDSNHDGVINGEDQLKDEKDSIQRRKELFDYVRILRFYQQLDNESGAPRDFSDEIERARKGYIDEKYWYVATLETSKDSNNDDDNHNIAQRA